MATAAKTVERRSLGLATTTSIVLGNMVGSGVFLLPATMAAYGAYSLLGWSVSTIGALLLAWVFANLARRVSKAGGPYAYPREAFGDFAGFQIAWIYWLSIVATNAAIAVAFASYLVIFVPALKEPLYGTLAALAASWLLTGINILGVKAAGRLQFVTVVLKLTPLVVLAVFGLSHFNLGTFTSGHIAESPLSAVNSTAALAMWAFLGLECATVPADHVKDPEKTIPRATMLGTIIAGAFYIVCTSVVMGIIPADVLAKSNAPFADAAGLLWGSWAGKLIAATALISCFGALNGWILMQGQLPQAVADNGLFPKVLAKQSKYGTPVTALLVSSVIASGLLLMSYFGSTLNGGLGQALVKMFNILILITTFFTLVPYMLCALAELVLDKKRNPQKYRFYGQVLLVVAVVAACIFAYLGYFATLAFWGVLLVVLAVAFYLIFGKRSFPAWSFVFGLWACYGTGEDSLFYGTLMLLAGLPIYVWQTGKVSKAK